MSICQVLLLKDVNIGKMGNVITVKSGYARNFLIPKQMATFFFVKDRSCLEYQRKIIKQKSEIDRKKIELLSKKLNAIDITIYARTTHKGKLFGSIVSKDISKILNKKGITVIPKEVVISKPIKTTGVHRIQVVFNANACSTLNITVISKHT